MSQPPANPYPSQPESGSQHGSYPPPQQPGGYPPPQSGAYPGQPGQPYGDPTAPPAKKKSSAGKIVLIVLAVLLVLCVGGGAVAYFVFKDEVKDTVDATKTRVVAPTTLAGRPQITEPELQKVSDEMVAEMKSTVQGETSAAGGFYGDPAKKDLVMIAAASGVLADPKKELDDAVNGLSTELGVSNMQAVEPGPLGGEAKCGDGKAEDAPLGVCVWADKGSVGMVVLFFKSGDEAKAEFATMRGQIEQKN